MNKIFLIIFLITKVNLQLNSPVLNFKVSKNKGFQVLLEDEPGIQLFSINVNLNVDIFENEMGDIFLETRNPKDGFWIVQENETAVKVNDVFNYWFYVQKGDLGQSFYNQHYLVEKFHDDTSKPCSRSRTIVNNYKIDRICSGEIVFEDSFEDNSVDMNKWTVQHRLPRFPDYEFSRYDREQVRIVSGQMAIKPKITDRGEDFIMTGSLALGSSCTSNHPLECNRTSFGFNVQHPIISGQLLSKPSFKYGKFEVRVKLPLGDWLYPQIVLTPAFDTIINPFSRIVIAFTRGNSVLNYSVKEEGARNLYGGYTTKINVKNIAIALNRTENRYENWASYFHKYTVIWTPHDLTVAVDNQIYGVIKTKIDREMHVCLGVGVGGITSFLDSKRIRKPWKNSSPKGMLYFWADRRNWMDTWTTDSEMVVEYVRAYAL